MTYYQLEKLSERLYRIIELGDVCCYLVIGDNKACLLDTGCGYGNLKELVETITDKPVFVILTHGHHDHMGAAALFDEVYMNHDDMPVFNEFGDMNRRLQDALEHDITKHFTSKDLIPTRQSEIKDIKDGDTFDLGGMTIKMIAVKGHTPGIMCPLLVEDKTIIFGDACGVSVLLFDEYSSTVSEYKNSLMKLKQFEEQYDRIYRNHGTFWSPKELLDNVLECCDLILTDKDDRQPNTIHGFELFAARSINENGRIDGKQGNIMYAMDKAK